MATKRYAPESSESSERRKVQCLAPRPSDACPVVVKMKRSGGKVVQEYDTYIGRKETKGGWNLTWSKWANPYRVGPDLPTPRHVLEKYEAYVRNKPELMGALHELAGKRLGCWCKPKPCHGDVLVKLFKEWKAQVDETQ